VEGCDDDETGKVFLALVKFDGLAIMLNLVTSKKTYLAAVINSSDKDTAELGRFVRSFN
jgi:hypothetical protein